MGGECGEGKCRANELTNGERGGRYPFMSAKARVEGAHSAKHVRERLAELSVHQPAMRVRPASARLRSCTGGEASAAKNKRTIMPTNRIVNILFPPFARLFASFLLVTVKIILTPNINRPRVDYVDCSKKN
jgi:hypothetical protein